ncbi:MAG: DUF983 domain-containing protein [Hyphomicrobiales bacterium]|nr:DUF983 domain-containing protein [Hyphomicrobiales bacterium]
MAGDRSGDAPLGQTLWRGLRGRCPRCGQASVFRGFLDIVDACPSCGLNFAGHDAGDGPAVAGTFILGFAAIGLAIFVEFRFEPPLWVHVLLWTPFVLGGAVAILRPLKGMTVALQYRYRDVDTPTRPGAQ